MSGVMISEIQDEVFGKCIKMTNGLVELRVTVDFGPRVIYFSAAGKENMFYNDIKKSPLGEPYEQFSGDILRLYGGHRLWISPEVTPRCYHPDNNPVTYAEIENGMEFVAAVEQFSGIQKTISITLSPDRPDVMLDHRIKNLGAWDIELAPWAITMMDIGGKEIMPMPDRQTGYLPNRNFTFWDYTELNDERLYLGKEYLALSQNPQKVNPIKIGYNNESGWVSYFNKGQVFFKFFEPLFDGDYPDNGCSYETYTNGAMLECETLGEMVILPPGEEISHAEEWEIYEESVVPANNDAEIKKVLSKYIN